MTDLSLLDDIIAHAHLIERLSTGEVMRLLRRRDINRFELIDALRDAGFINKAVSIGGKTRWVWVDPAL